MDVIRKREGAMGDKVGNDERSGLLCSVGLKGHRNGVRMGKRKNAKASRRER